MVYSIQRCIVEGAGSALQAGDSIMHRDEYKEQDTLCDCALPIVYIRMHNNK